MTLSEVKFQNLGILAYNKHLRYIPAAGSVEPNGLAYDPFEEEPNFM